MITPGLTEMLNELYTGCCHSDEGGISCHSEVRGIPNLAASDEFETALTQMIENIWQLKGMRESIDKGVTRHFANELSKAVAEGFGSSFDAIDYDTPDGEMLASLRNNVYQFSAAKNYHQLKELSQALLNEEGHLRTYSQFKEAAMQINDTHVNQWLKAEYNLAVSSGQMAASWVRITANKETLPMLEFDAVMDQRTTQTCRSLNGVVRPVDDPFWSQYYPPNHFGCRSDVRPHPGSRTVTPESTIDYPEIPAMFKTNLAKKGLVFPPKHPYWIGLPDDIIKQGENLIP